MKTVLRFSLAACLLVVLSSGALAATPSFLVDDSVRVGMGTEIQMIMNIYSPGEHLFSVEEQGARLEFQGIFGYGGPDMTLVRGEYTLSDFVYGTLSYEDNAEATNLRGGYLWEDLGVFAVVDYSSTSGGSGYIATGGYRFDLGGGSYAALSLDYYGGDYEGMFAGQAAAKYYADGLKVSGQLYVYEDGDYMIHGKANVAAGDRLVWGGGLTWYDSDAYEVFAGATWTGENGVFDGIVDVDDAGNITYYLSYLHSFGDALAVGLSYLNGDSMSDGWIGLKGRYQLGDGKVSCSYATSAGGGEGAFIGLGYEKSL